MELDIKKEPGQTAAAWLARRPLLGLLPITTAIVITGVLILFRGQLTDFKNYGYLGAFIISMLSAATIIVPVPGLAVVFVLGGLLNPIFVGVASGAGEPLGELTGYMAGRGGHIAIKTRNRLNYEQIEAWMKRRGMLLVFVAASFPNPAFDLIGAAAGATRMPLWKFLLACWAGKTIKGLGIAVAGYFGLRLFLKLFNISI